MLGNLASLFGYGRPSGGKFENYGNWTNQSQFAQDDPMGSFMVDKGILQSPIGSTGFLDKMGGTKGLMTGLGALGGLSNAWLGMKQYGMAKDALKEGKRQFQLNYDAQKKLTNSQLEDRQKARVASNPNEYESSYDYMKKYGI